MRERRHAKEKKRKEKQHRRHRRHRQARDDGAGDEELEYAEEAPPRRCAALGVLSLRGKLAQGQQLSVIQGCKVKLAEGERGLLSWSRSVPGVEQRQSRTHL